MPSSNAELIKCGKRESYAAWMCLLYYIVGLWAAMSVLVKGGALSEDRPAVAFCQTSSKDFAQLLIAGFQAADPSRGGSNSITLRNLSISIPMFKIREIELKNTQNFFVNEDSTITCDENDIKVNLSFGMRDPEIILKEKPGSTGTFSVTLSYFEAEAIVTLPRRDTKIIVDAINILRMDHIKVEVKENSRINSDTINNLLKNIPKRTLTSVISKYMTKAVQDYLYSNPFGI
ncbi:uncharacterized protein LOC111250598 [Varroa destructor]|uniref:Uncharacterized protein n=1 Tax=Varroa destructor TaxID=109461 RepID=A0A7M7K5C4_VARDE|nr:uncharacterized protein LOC111250598 [Varroa destructor]